MANYAIRKVFVLAGTTILRPCYNILCDASPVPDITK